MYATLFTVLHTFNCKVHFSLYSTLLTYVDLTVKYTFHSTLHCNAVITVLRTFLYWADLNELLLFYCFHSYYCCVIISLKWIILISPTSTGFNVLYFIHRTVLNSLCCKHLLAIYSSNCTHQTDSVVGWLSYLGKTFTKSTHHLPLGPGAVVARAVARATAAATVHYLGHEFLRLLCPVPSGQLEHVEQVFLHSQDGKPWLGVVRPAFTDDFCHFTHQLREEEDDIITIQYFDNRNFKNIFSNKI